MVFDFIRRVFELQTLEKFLLHIFLIKRNFLLCDRMRQVRRLNPFFGPGLLRLHSFQPGVSLLRGRGVGVIGEIVVVNPIVARQCGVRFLCEHRLRDILDLRLVKNGFPHLILIFEH